MLYVVNKRACTWFVEQLPNHRRRNLKDVEEHLQSRIPSRFVTTSVWFLRAGYGCIYIYIYIHTSLSLSLSLSLSIYMYMPPKGLRQGRRLPVRRGRELERRSERDEWGQHQWGHRKCRVFDRGTFLDTPAITYFLSSQKCQGVPFSPICQNRYFCSGLISTDPICPQPTWDVSWVWYY